MLSRLLQRVLYTLPVIWLVVSLVFLLIHLVPGDPIAQMLGEGAPAADIAATRHAYGLDAPLGEQYIHYWKGVLHGDLGTLHPLQPDRDAAWPKRYPYTLRLTLASLLRGDRSFDPRRSPLRPPPQPLGRPPALRRQPVRPVVPQLCAGPILILLFAIKLGWLPVSGAGSFANLVLPALTMGSALAAILTRMVRTSMLEELSQDYIRTARAKGLPERTVVYRHALRNAMIPVLTVLGLQFGALLAGAIVTEKIFSWPGIGRLTVDAISARDYFLVQGCILAIGLTYVAVNFLTDVLYSVANPRIRQ